MTKLLSRRQDRPADRLRVVAHAAQVQGVPGQAAGRQDQLRVRQQQGQTGQGRQGGGQRQGRRGRAARPAPPDRRGGAGADVPAPAATAATGRAQEGVPELPVRRSRQPSPRPSALPRRSRRRRPRPEELQPSSRPPARKPRRSLQRPSPLAPPRQPAAGTAARQEVGLRSVVAAAHHDALRLMYPLARWPASPAGRIDRRSIRSALSIEDATGKACRKLTGREPTGRGCRGSTSRRAAAAPRKRQKARVRTCSTASHGCLRIGCSPTVRSSGIPTSSSRAPSGADPWLSPRLLHQFDALSRDAGTAGRGARPRSRRLLPRRRLSHEARARKARSSRGLYQREMPNLVYTPQTAAGSPARTDRRIEAIAFVARRDHPSYLRLSRDEILRRLSSCRGGRGHNREYAINTWHALREWGIEDAGLAPSPGIWKRWIAPHEDPRTSLPAALALPTALRRRT